ncbi:hypothetical protein [Flavobacterium sp. N1994]|uniref:hypothetical protein n=1 Tax=Flavobacterium sp. N1994 TaxID=2986827 RepID=UPI0022237CC9|nr:hypothetical protein [Flavobacterium sp. N1994]
MKKRVLISFILTLMLGITSGYSQGCSGQFKTFTIGGWGTNCNGNNPGCYRDANFDAAFPDGVMIGCGSNTLTFTSSSAVANYLPAGGSPAVLNGSATDPTTSRGVLSSQVLAIALAVGFDVYDPNFSTSSTSFGSLTIKSGTFAGMSIANFLQLANNVLGGCSTQYSLSAINDAATAINQNFDNGTVDNGYINCSRGISLNIQIGSNPDVCQDGNGLVTITITGGTAPYQLKIYKNNVLISTVNSNDAVAYLSGLGTGNFSVTVTDGNSQSATGTWTL